jgi:hypothetical protein
MCWTPLFANKHKLEKSQKGRGNIDTCIFTFWVLCCDVSYDFSMSFRFEFLVVMSVTVSAYKRCSVRLYPQLFVGVRMCYLPYLCLLM